MDVNKGKTGALFNVYSNRGPQVDKSVNYKGN